MLCKLVAIPLDGFFEAFEQVLFGLPAQQLLSLSDVRQATFRIVHRQRLLDDFALRSCQLFDQGGEFKDCLFFGIAQINWQMVLDFHQTPDAFD